MEIFEKIVLELKKREMYVSTMESCTGGGLASEITNHSGASEVLKFSAVTYSNEFKIKMGVDEKVIDEFSVYSINTAREMAENISKFTQSDYGIVITGKLNNPDPANNYGKDDIIFVAIYSKHTNQFYEYELKAKENVPRKENKEYIIDFIGQKFLNIIVNS